MLGFSPLASALLADDGVVAAVAHLLTAAPITTGNPTVGASDIAQEHDLSLTAIDRKSVV